MLHVFTGKRSNIKKVVCDGIGNSISYKMISVYTPRSKTVGGDTFLVAKNYFLEGGKNTSSCNYVSNINVNNNKTADIIALMK